jgi:hypothetical protein
LFQVHNCKYPTLWRDGGGGGGGGDDDDDDDDNNNNNNNLSVGVNCFDLMLR